MEVHRLMRAVRFNCHEVLDGFSLDDDGSPPDRIGFALNPNLAMINHSCDPNIGRVWLNGADHVIGKILRYHCVQGGPCEFYTGYGDEIEIFRAAIRVLLQFMVIQ